VKRLGYSLLKSVTGKPSSYSYSLNVSLILAFRFCPMSW
jgi:hypothetical protein